MSDRLSGKRLHTADSFWGLVDISGGPESCWPWQGSVASTGYGQLGFHRTHANAHRVAYTLWHGQEPAKGMHLDHLCRMPLCVNPAHLRVVTPRENTMAPGSLAPAKRNLAKTHCPEGHPYSGENLMIAGRNQRHCRACSRARVNARRARARLGEAVVRRPLKTHCKYGHAYSGRDRAGDQVCNQCHANRERVRQQRLRAVASWT